MINPDEGVTHYTYNLEHQIIRTTDPQRLTTHYTYDAAKRLTQITLGNGVKTLYTYSDANSLIKVEHRKSDDTFINSFDYVQDAVGNRTRLTEANGDYTDYAYDNIYQRLSEVKKDSSEDSGLMLLTLRYYDATLGRFITRDPASVGPNLYVYVSNNPLKYVDPTGLRPISPAEEVAAELMFGPSGTMIDFSKVNIIEGGRRARILCGKPERYKWKGLVLYNTVYFSKANPPLSLVIHELMPVWRYNNLRLDPVGGGVTHLIAAAIGKTKAVYDYDLYEDKPFQDYNFEEQAEILADAYRVLHGNANPGPHYKPKLSRTLADRKKFFEKRLEEFRQWHQALQMK